MYLSTNVRYLRKKLSLSQKELGRKTGISRNTISRIEAGTWKGYLETIDDLAGFFGVSFKAIQEIDLTVETVIRPPESGGAASHSDIDIYDRIPLLTSFPAGPWKSWIDTHPVGFGEETVSRYGVRGDHVVAIRVEGDSMIPDLMEGDILMLDPEKAFTDMKGGIGVVRFEESFKIRKVYLRGDNYLLEPSNKAYEAEIIPVTGTTIFRIVKMIREM